MSKALLDSALWFKDAPDTFKEDLSKIMKPIDAADGQIFREEGKPIKDFFIVEKGILERTKLPACADATPVHVDFIGPGQVTGLLLVASEENPIAFGTTKSKGAAKVWSVSGDDFRSMLLANPSNALSLIQIFSKDMRMGNSTLQGLAKKFKASNTEIESGVKNGGAKMCKVMCYDTTSWVKENFEPFIEEFNKSHDNVKIQMRFTQDKLDIHSVMYAAGYDAVCLFVNDTANREVIRLLSVCGVRMIAMRCAGFDRIDISAAEAFGITIARVPAYSPYSVAEHAIALLMTVNRKIHTASARVKMANFTLDSGLLGIDIHGKTVGVLGTGKIGQILCRIIKGFGATLLAYDIIESDAVKEIGGTYVSKDDIYEQCDVIFLMMPLLPATKHTINESVLPKLKKGVLIINTSRGGLIDTNALIAGLRSGTIGGCGLDVYENEGDYFFQDWSARSIEDSTLVSLLGNNKVVMTAHQAFFTKEAVDAICQTTIKNLEDFCVGLRGKDLQNSVSLVD